MKNLLLIFSTITLIGSVYCEQRKIVCYWQGRIDVSLIDPHMCTHVVFAFVSTDPQGGVFVNSALGKKIKGLVDLRTINPDLKIMVSLFDNFKTISAEARETFADNLLNFLNEYELDGADIDWEYPSASDRGNLELLLHEIRIRLQPCGKLLTAAVGPCDNLANSYDTKSLIAEVDFVNIMTYNLHSGSWENHTANHGNYWDLKSKYNVITCLNYWIKSGLPHNKMVIGIPTYSRNYQLDDPEDNGVGALATFKRFGQAGEIPSSYSYSTICKNILENGWTRGYDNLRSTGPYAYSGTTWAGYDDVESIREKALMVKKVDYGGILFWSLDHEDHSGDCGDGKFPLIKSVWNIIMN